jgi:hypothetical protein
MSRIKLYPNDTNIAGGDRLVGTDITGNATKNYQIEEIAKYFAQTGGADPTRTGFQYNYAGTYSNQTIASGEFRYQVDPSAPAQYGWANITGIAISKINRNGVDVSPVVSLVTNQILKLTDVDSSLANSYGMYVVDSQSFISNESAYLLALTHKGSVGTPSSEVLTISLSGLSSPSFVYTQATPATNWVITHNLNTYPSVTVVDSSGAVVIGAVAYNNKNQIAITFTSAFSGKAYLN